MTARHMNTGLGRVLVLGLSSTGQAVARYCAARLGGRVKSVTVYDSSEEPNRQVVDELKSLGCELCTGTSDVTGSYALAVASPGISPSNPLAISAALASYELIGEPEFAWRESPERWIGITGTNGKTTTTSLTTALLNASGIAAKAVGNIGEVITECVDSREPGSWFVAELSSYQLYTTRKLHPRIACILNITPDHLKWHGSFENYAESKERIFRNMDGDDLAVVNIDDSLCDEIALRLRERGLRVCRLSCTCEPSGADAAFVRGGNLYVRLNNIEHELVARAEMLLPGDHNVQNALAASAMAIEAGANPAAVRDVLRRFAPLEHRIESCGELDGVHFVNDSKATDTDAVEKALASFGPGSVVLLAGGTDKGTELEEFCARIAPQLAAVVCYGEAGERFEGAFADALRGSAARVLRAEHMADAFEKGCEIAQPGNTVLLSPACASFDEFSGFEERGERFKEMVAEYISQKAHVR